MILIKILAVISYAIVNILLAKHDALKISRQQKIEHGTNALIYLALISPVIYVTQSLVFLIGLLALRRVVFDTALNLFRGLKHDYISATTTSIIDRLSYKFQEKFGYITYYGIFTIIVILSIFL